VIYYDDSAAMVPVHYTDGARNKTTICWYRAQSARLAARIMARRQTTGPRESVRYGDVNLFSELITAADTDTVFS